MNFENITQENLNGANIRKHNDLIEAKYQLPNLQEQRLILMLLSQIKTADEDFKSYRITVADFAEFIGLKGKDVYAELDRTALALVSRTVSIRNGKSFLHVNWLSSAKYQSGSGYVELAFDPNLKPYLLQLKSHYTQYKLDMAIHFKSIYSIRLYELLKKEAFKERNGYFDVLFEYSELRENFGVGKKEYLKFNNFKQKAIEPATREISDKTDLYINDVRYGKTGRKITNITFCVQIRTENETKLRQANLRIEDIKPEKESENHPIIETLISLGFSFEIAQKYKTKHGVKKIERNITYTLAKKQEGKIGDIPAYLNKAIENDYGGAWDIENQKKLEAKKEKDRLEKEANDKAEKATLASKEKYAITLQRFYALSAELQIDAEQKFFDSLRGNSIMMGQWKKAEKENKSPLESIMIQKTFIKFLLDNNICGAE